MENYYNYFVAKGNHPQKEKILDQETKYNFNGFDSGTAKMIINKIVTSSKQYPRPIASRIMYKDKIVEQYQDKQIVNLDWLSKKEKVCNETKHSSYYIFLNNIDTHCFDYMTLDKSYGICGGAFPLIVDGKMVGTISVTGLRPQEDHDIIIQALESISKTYRMQ